MRTYSLYAGMIGAVDYLLHDVQVTRCAIEMTFSPIDMFGNRILPPRYPAHQEHCPKQFHFIHATHPMHQYPSDLWNPRCPFFPHLEVALAV